MKWYLFLLAFAAIFPQIAFADSLRGSVQMGDISSTGMNNQYSVTFRICAVGDQLVTPTININSDMQQTSRVDQEIIGANACSWFNITVLAKDAKSISITSPGIPTTWINKDGVAPLWTQNVYAWAQQGKVSMQDYYQMVNYLKTLGIWPQT